MDNIQRKQREIAIRVRALLKESKHSQKWLADETELGEPSISAILKGARNLTLDTIVRLEIALGAKVIVIPKDSKT